jgi:hypothetical protein
MKSDHIISSIESVTKNWTKQRKREEREASARFNRSIRLNRRRITLKDAVAEHLEDAYMAASSNGSLPAHARQIMYQIRPAVQAMTGERLNDAYFTQTLLPDAIVDYGYQWDVVFDERGHFSEPHSQQNKIGLGTISVRNYLGRMRGPSLSDLAVETPELITHGPDHRFGAVLFIEKEGFMPLFERVSLAERYDLAIMSTKGLSNTASRELVEEICGRYDIPLLVMHDFDKAGFSILASLKQSNRRYRFTRQFEVIDLGLRLADVEELDLDPEATFDRGSEGKRRQNLRRNGATEAEVEFLLDNRVELNALTSDQLVQFIEMKLADHAIKKVLPSEEWVDHLYRNHLAARYVEDNVEEIIEAGIEFSDKAEVPENIIDSLKERLTREPSEPWDKLVVEIAEESYRDKRSKDND